MFIKIKSSKIHFVQLICLCFTVITASVPDVYFIFADHPF
ncbi:hypothetical protein CLOLEP_01674 [[Clostridium] leptum DSM 753]|uniref:Uncharacterized protein n=1 Tax=[Clostridium] leptum DSM 753 TaxID=428125 RepID=A7VSY3_9FIRM|nr:hypothetical protein CLOLEP_01674 [[Clostridium] leptum DSM 753]